MKVYQVQIWCLHNWWHLQKTAQVQKLDLVVLLYLRCNQNLPLSEYLKGLIEKHPVKMLMADPQKVNPEKSQDQ